jgi:hypothetical protein
MGLALRIGRARGYRIPRNVPRLTDWAGVRSCGPTVGAFLGLLVAGTDQAADPMSIDSAPWKGEGARPVKSGRQLDPSSVIQEFAPNWHARGGTSHAWGASGVLFRSQDETSFAEEER